MSTSRWQRFASIVKRRHDGPAAHPDRAAARAHTDIGELRPVITETFPAEDIARYYDSWNERYEAVFGEVFQHLKSADGPELLDHMIEITRVSDGERLVDAGCGVGGPARAFARARDVHIDAVTISPVQVARASELVQTAGLSDRIDVRLGDFHHLGAVVEQGSADLVYFLESLVHSEDPPQALRSAFEILRAGGRLYVKDFYRGRSDDPSAQLEIDECVEATNRICHLTIRNTEDMLRWITECGFEVEVAQPLSVSGYSIDDGHEFCRRYDLDVAAGRDFTTTFYLDNLEVLARKPV